MTPQHSPLPSGPWRDSSAPHFILFGEASLRRALKNFCEHYHAGRNHQGKANTLLFPRPTPRKCAARAMPGAIGRGAQVLSAGGGIKVAQRSNSPDFTGQDFSAWVSGSQADAGEALVVVAGLAAVMGGLGPQHSVPDHGIRLAFFSSRRRNRSHDPPRASWVSLPADGSGMLSHFRGQRVEATRGFFWRRSGLG